MKCFFYFVISLFFYAFAHSAATLYEGSLDGAPYVVAKPAEWVEGKVFFHVHGWRPDWAPHEADLNLEAPFYKELLKEGWLIGRTAFLENGVDHEAHTLALRDLKAWIETEMGPVQTLVLEGESTAGSLVLRIAEQDADLADGVIALGPFIDLEDSTADSFLTAKPLLPSILMSNTTEIIEALKYAAIAEDAKYPPSLRPLRRPGHVNVNWVERLAALKALETWMDGGSAIGFRDGTRKVPARATGTVEADGYLENRVTSVIPYYGNAFLGFHPDEWIEAGLSIGSPFEIEAGGETWSVLFGNSYGDVPLGGWVAFPTADEQIMLVRNHGNAIESANLKVGDVIKIKMQH
jgi:pimeloyl-ACP methyl ester carboxylesterase